MSKIIGINIYDEDRLYYVVSNLESDIKIGSNVIVSLEFGSRFAKVIKIIEDSSEMPVIGDIVRIATDEDVSTHNKNLVDQKKAMEKCKKLILKYKLNMNLIKAEFSFDRSQLLINFSSDERVDFRDLAKQMASIFKTRIEFRQIGVRDKAKVIGGIGPCGRKLCCSSFLYNFDSISIGMAKNQMLALNPNKINGSCGRLLCCLNYEDEIYKEFRKSLPILGKVIELDGKKCKVVQLDLYNQKYIVQFEDGSQKEVMVNNNGTDE